MHHLEDKLPLLKSAVQRRINGCSETFMTFLDLLEMVNLSKFPNDQSYTFKVGEYNGIPCPRFTSDLGKIIHIFSPNHTGDRARLFVMNEILLANSAPSCSLTVEDSNDTRDQQTNNLLLVCLGVWPLILNHHGVRVFLAN
ncbi:hypothetical protein SAY87_022160 [Trapa incisa]|uniref:Uncharacterized protein n=1 Tax=Trapa incisa TaxID=236973 RepID=A0AAN7PS46_9MYRT|nr:hypothetical protein SAY87_022160 [Trapa incisa]